MNHAAPCDRRRRFDDVDIQPEKTYVYAAQSRWPEEPSWRDPETIDKSDWRRSPDRARVDAQDLLLTSPKGTVTRILCRELGPWMVLD